MSKNMHNLPHSLLDTEVSLSGPGCQPVVVISGLLALILSHDFSLKKSCIAFKCDEARKR